MGLCNPLRCSTHFTPTIDAMLCRLTRYCPYRCLPKVEVTALIFSVNVIHQAATMAIDQKYPSTVPAATSPLGVLADMGAAESLQWQKLVQKVSGNLSGQKEFKDLKTYPPNNQVQDCYTGDLDPTISSDLAVAVLRSIDCQRV